MTCASDGHDWEPATVGDHAVGRECTVCGREQGDVNGHPPPPVVRLPAREDRT